MVIIRQTFPIYSLLFPFGKSISLRLVRLYLPGSPVKTALTLAFSSDIIESFLSKYVFLNAIYLSLLSSTYTFLRKKSSLTIWLTMLYPFKKKLRHFKICLLHLITLGYMILYYFVHIYHL